MKIAIVGTGISSLTAARMLSQKYEISVFESSNRLGGHTATKVIEREGVEYPVDTGFIVFNDKTYPNFIKLMNRLGVKFRNSSMGFSVSDYETGLEYAGRSLDTMFAQRSNMLKPNFIRMVSDIVRFNKQSSHALEMGSIPPDQSLSDWLKQGKYGALFCSHYLVPMGSAIWSTSITDMLKMPALFFIRFFKNHGLLQIKDRPQWMVLEGGSQAYLEPLVVPFKSQIFLNHHISTIERSSKGVSLHFEGPPSQHFDHVVIGCHSDEALKLLKNPSVEEQQILGAIPYVQNEVTLHQDTSLMPRNRKAWSAWNYRMGASETDLPILSYNMNILQHHPEAHPFIVTLNANRLINPDKVLGNYQYSHPVFNAESVAAQQKWNLINGVQRTWFCGAYWRNGFHEDGCFSGIRVANKLGVSWQ